MVDTSFSTSFTLNKQGATLITLGLKRPLTGRNSLAEIEGEDYDGQSGATKDVIEVPVSDVPENARFTPISRRSKPKLPQAVVSKSSHLLSRLTEPSRRESLISPNGFAGQ